jgi:hypothetical protein
LTRESLTGCPELFSQFARSPNNFDAGKCSKKN